MTEIKTYSVQIIDHIKKSLLSGELMPGDKVNEVHLAAALSISRAPVREALQMLVNEGLIDSIPQRGKFIKALTPNYIRDSYFIGGVLEGAAVGSSITEFTEEDFTVLQELVVRMAELEAGPTYAENLAHLDAAFHTRLLSKTKNSLIGEYSRKASQRMSKFLLFRYWPNAFTHEEVILRHQKVVDAVRTRDPYPVEQSIREHYQKVGERMATLVMETPGDKRDKSTQE